MKGRHGEQSGMAYMLILRRRKKKNLPASLCWHDHPDCSTRLACSFSPYTSACTCSLAKSVIPVKMDSLRHEVCENGLIASVSFPNAGSDFFLSARVATSMPSRDKFWSRDEQYLRMASDFFIGIRLHGKTVLAILPI